MASPVDEEAETTSLVTGEPLTEKKSSGPRRILGETAAIKDKPGSWWRWVTLLLISLCMVGSYYCYDNPAALKRQLQVAFAKDSDSCYHCLKDKSPPPPPPSKPPPPSSLKSSNPVTFQSSAHSIAYFNDEDQITPHSQRRNLLKDSSDSKSCSSCLSDTQYNLFYSVYSFPNTVLPFFGGVLVDSMGQRFSLVLFTGLILCGQALFAGGVTMQNYVMSLMGRVVFGFGGESLCVVQSAITAEWFRGREVALAMGLNLTFARLGSVINDWISPALFKSSTAVNYSNKVQLPLWIGFVITIASFFFGLFFVVLDYIFIINHRRKRVEGSIREGSINGVKNPLLESLRDNDQEMDNETYTLVLKALDSSDEKGETLSWKDLKDLDHRFWLLTVSCVVTYCSVLPFNNIASDLLQERYDYEVSEADHLMSIPYFLGAGLTPAFGFVADWIPRSKIILLLFAPAILVGAHTILALSTSISPYIPLIGIGIAFSIYASALWPSIPLVVPERALGTAYGVITAIQNLGLALTPIMVGVIKDNLNGYVPVEFLFVGVAAIGVIDALVLQFIAKPLIPKDEESEDDIREPLIAKSDI